MDAHECIYLSRRTCLSFKAENGILPPFPIQLTFFAKSVEKMLWASRLLTFDFKFSPPIVDKDLAFIIKFQKRLSISYKIQYYSLMEAQIIQKNIYARNKFHPLH